MTKKYTRAKKALRSLIKHAKKHVARVTIHDEAYVMALVHNAKSFMQTNHPDFDGLDPFLKDFEERMRKKVGM